MNRLANIIQGLNAQDLALIEQDLKAGNIERLIAQRRKYLSKSNETVCPVCGAKTHKDRGFALEFGPQDLRQQAVFDAPDCLRYFLEERLQHAHEKR